MSPKPTTPKEYLASLPADRRAAVEAIRKVIRANLDPKITEGIQYGMLGYFLPHSVYPAGYHCDPKQPLPFASVASQKNHMAVYLFCLYCDPAEVERFQREWKAAGKKLDMGKSCVRFKKLEDVPLDVLGAAFKRLTAKRFVAAYEASLAGTKAAPQKKATTKKAAKKATKKVAKKPAAKKTATKKPVAKKPVAKKPVAKKAAKKAGAAKVLGAKRKVAAKKTAAKVTKQATSAGRKK